jgi:glycosyltransferase involved in cell wall biosynthesis
MPKRIALCITELETGGAERMLVDLAKRLDRSRFEPVVYSLGPRPRSNHPTPADELEAAGIEAHYLDARGARDFPRTLLRLTDLFRSSRPDVVQTFLFHANFLGAWAARRAGVRRIVTGIRVAEQGRAWHRWLARRTSHWADRHVCVSQDVARFSTQVTGVASQSLVVISNGVDAARFAAPPVDLASLGVPAGQHVLACIGRLDRQKGVDWLLDLLPAVFARQSTHDLLVVGQGPDESALRRQARRLGIDQRVHFVGLRADVAGIMAAIDLLVLPSRWEGMPNVLLEAMAAGRPVVATAVEGVAEVLGAAAEEQMSPACDSQLFTDKTVAIINDRNLALRLGSENQRRVCERFSLGAMVTAYERLYEALC